MLRAVTPQPAWRSGLAPVALSPRAPTSPLPLRPQGRRGLGGEGFCECREFKLRHHRIARRGRAGLNGGMKVLIAGGGIGGLTAALSLHAAGIEAEMFEQVPALRELGVGINTLPHAISELAALGLLPALDAAGIRTRELIYANRFGQTVWQELRGTDAGYDMPQFSIHRGKLHGVLHRAALERLGPARLNTGCRLAGFDERGAGSSRTLRAARGRRAVRRRGRCAGGRGRHPLRGARAALSRTRGRPPGAASCCGGVPPTGRSTATGGRW